MKIDRKLIGALLIGILVLSSSAYSISISVESNAGGFKENINAGDKDAVYSSTVIAANSLSHSIEGSGSLKESHSVSNTAGANAGVGVNIRQAEWYSYSYDLWPGLGSSWPASKFAQVAASEQLDVLNAKYIQAYANARNSKGYTAGVSTVISDPGNGAYLNGYRNLAMASKNEAFASQTADGAFSPDGYIQADSGADFTQLKSKPLQFREDTADASLRVDRGSVEGYSDLASASANGVTASQQIDVATGDQIQTRSESASWTASLFQGLKKTAGAKVNIKAEGTLTGYNASAESSKDYAQADQEGHIVGTFTNTATAGSASKTRSSNYGTMYDFNMQAKKDASGSYATGNLGYYVDSINPIANRIQGAVDASESGDAINVAPGTYFENVHIDKSLSVKGAGASDTIVDGQQAGSGFNINDSQDNAELDVALSGMTIQNGIGTPSGGYLLNYGGGIYNSEKLVVTDCSISNNRLPSGERLYIAGGGIFNRGTITMNGGSVNGNDVLGDGGGIWNMGTANLNGVSISDNGVKNNGGGIYNRGTMNINGGSINGNDAGFHGGGIYNNGGLVNLKGVSISGNTASIYVGGGIYNTGTVNMDGGSVSGNWASQFGSGIYNGGTVNLKGVSISDNSADWGRGNGIYNYGTVNMEGGSISGNSADYSELGGGIYNGGTVNLKRVSISGNSADYGGGIYNTGTVNLNDASSITDNTATDGGGIYNNGGTVSGNLNLVHDNHPNNIAP